MLPMLEEGGAGAGVEAGLGAVDEVEGPWDELVHLNLESPRTRRSSQPHSALQ